MYKGGKSEVAKIICLDSMHQIFACNTHLNLLDILLGGFSSYISWNFQERSFANIIEQALRGPEASVQIFSYLPNIKNKSISIYFSFIFCVSYFFFPLSSIFFQIKHSFRLCLDRGKVKVKKRKEGRKWVSTVWLEGKLERK